ncbi:MAG: Smt3-specific protease [Phylliscum demangeonii]|nr:MAG: Smt3-specific protease [Phylliscum demangeonii]
MKFRVPGSSPPESPVPGGDLAQRFPHVRRYESLAAMPRYSARVQGRSRAYRLKMGLPCLTEGELLDKFYQDDLESARAAEEAAVEAEKAEREAAEAAAVAAVERQRAEEEAARLRAWDEQERHIVVPTMRSLGRGIPECVPVLIHGEVFMNGRRVDPVDVDPVTTDPVTVEAPTETNPVTVQANATDTTHATLQGSSRNPIQNPIRNPIGNPMAGTCTPRHPATVRLVVHRPEPAWKQRRRIVRPPPGLGLSQALFYTPPANRFAPGQSVNPLAYARHLPATAPRPAPAVRQASPRTPSPRTPSTVNHGPPQGIHRPRAIMARDPDSWNWIMPSLAASQVNFENDAARDIVRGPGATPGPDDDSAERTRACVMPGSFPGTLPPSPRAVRMASLLAQPRVPPIRFRRPAMPGAFPRADGRPPMLEIMHYPTRPYVPAAGVKRRHDQVDREEPHSLIDNATLATFVVAVTVMVSPVLAFHAARSSCQLVERVWTRARRVRVRDYHARGWRLTQRQLVAEIGVESARIKRLCVEIYSPFDPYVQRVRELAPFGVLGRANYRTSTPYPGLTGPVRDQGPIATAPTEGPDHRPMPDVAAAAIPAAAGDHPMPDVAAAAIPAAAGDHPMPDVAAAAIPAAAGDHPMPDVAAAGIPATADDHPMLDVAAAGSPATTADDHSVSVYSDLSDLSDTSFLALANQFAEPAAQAKSLEPTTRARDAFLEARRSQGSTADDTATAATAAVENGTEHDASMADDTATAATAAVENGTEHGASIADDTATAPPAAAHVDADDDSSMDGVEFLASLAAAAGGVSDDDSSMDGDAVLVSLAAAAGGVSDDDSSMDGDALLASLAVAAGDVTDSSMEDGSAAGLSAAAGDVADSSMEDGSAAGLSAAAGDVADSSMEDGSAAGLSAAAGDVADSPIEDGSAAGLSAAADDPATQATPAVALPAPADDLPIAAPVENEPENATASVSVAPWFEVDPLADIEEGDEPGLPPQALAPGSVEHRDATLILELSPDSRYMKKKERERAKREAKEAAAAAAQRRAEEAQREKEARVAALAVRIRPRGSVITELSATWETKVAEAVEGAERRVVGRSTTGVELTVKDVSTVAVKERWVNDEMINAYLEIVVAHGLRQQRTGATHDHNLRARAPPLYAAFNSFYYKALAGRGAEHVTRWMSRMNLKGKDLLECDRIFIPINDQAHWTLLLLSPTSRTIEYYDSLGHLGPAHSGSAEIDHIRKMLEYELKEDYHEEEWRVVHHESPQQTNAVDCGIFTMTTAKMIMLGIDPMAYSQSDIPFQRRCLVAEILHGGFTGEFAPDPAWFVVAPEEPATVEAEEPSTAESEEPSGAESEEPSGAESEEPSGAESEEPSTAESEEPSGAESEEPSGAESEEPSGAESEEPSTAESEELSGAESEETSTVEADEPTTVEAEEPTVVEPSTVESEEPSTIESQEPSTAESKDLSTAESEEPSRVQIEEEPPTVETEESLTV